MILEHGILGSDRWRDHLTIEEYRALRPELRVYGEAQVEYNACRARYHEARAAVERLVTQQNANRPWRDPWWDAFFEAEDALYAAEDDLHEACIAVLRADRAWRQAALELAKRERLISMAEDGR